MSHRNKKLLYHLTSIQNLPSIVANGLLPRATLQGSFEDVADPEILDGRATHGLDHYVPFHFRCRGPFDYAAIRSHPADGFVLLTVLREFAEGQGWRIVPRHPLAGGAAPQILDWADGMDAINWEKMDENGDWTTDDELKKVRMAEALSPGPVPFKRVFAVYVATEETKNKVEELVSDTWVNLMPSMFPNGCR